MIRTTTEQEQPTKYAVTQRDIFGVVRTFRLLWSMPLEQVEKIFPAGEVKEIPKAKKTMK